MMLIILMRGVSVTLILRKGARIAFRSHAASIAVLGELLLW